MSQKVFEFAKEVGLETLVLMDKIKEWNLPVKSHMSTLDEKTIEKIKSKLEAEAEAKSAASGKKKKKTAAKKKATATKKTATKKVAKKKTSAVKKPTVVKASKAASASATEVEKEDKKPKTTRKKVTRKAASGVVIRRKAADIAEQAEQDRIAAEEEASRAQSEDTGETGSVEDSSGSPSAPAVQVKRRNIVGRMDLSKAKPPPGAGAGAGSTASTDGRPQRPGGPARNIRAGFFAAPLPSMEDERAESFAEIQKRKEREERAKRKPGQGKEEEDQAFIAADFRKREVIFQPKKKRLAVNKDFKKTQLTVPKASKRVVKVDGTMSVHQLSQELGQKAPVIIKKLMQGGLMANMNTELDYDTVALICSEYNYEAENIFKTADQMIETSAFGNLETDMVTRPPVVTVMGHVDHGKTSLLDVIRKADVVSGEAGGITQHIGAYKVTLDNGKAVTFIDTPGHEAFTAMRARGANLTDIAIIVVAADDGVMPQTAEAINHAKAAGVPIIIAVNKMDKQGANPDRIKQQLTEYEIVPEEWGGSHIFCEVSAIEKTGIKELLEQILLIAEVEDLKANPERSALGIVIESRLEKGRGPVATILVQEGSVKAGDNIVAGTVVGRIRAMMNDKGEQVKLAGPGDPVEVLGFSETPGAGDVFVTTLDEESARKIAEVRAKEAAKERAAKGTGTSLEDLFKKAKNEAVIELPIVLKADVAGSIEAIKNMLEKTSTDEVKVKVVHAAVGGVNESDVLLASTAKGIIVGFNVRPDTSATSRAKEKGVDIKTYTIVYNLVDDMKKALSGLLTPDKIEKPMGRAEVREVFSVPKFGNIAGCMVQDGKISRTDQVRLVRDGVVVYEGVIGSLRRFKDNVKEVASGAECGIGIENFNDIKVGDVIEAYVIEEVAREL